MPGREGRARVEMEGGFWEDDCLRGGTVVPLEDLDLEIPLERRLSACSEERVGEGERGPSCSGTITQLSPGVPGVPSPPAPAAAATESALPGLFRPEPEADARALVRG
jgi:hypothetical protein